MPGLPVVLGLLTADNLYYNSRYLSAVSIFKKEVFYAAAHRYLSQKADFFETEIQTLISHYDATVLYYGGKYAEN